MSLVMHRKQLRQMDCLGVRFGGESRDEQSSVFGLDTVGGEEPDGALGPFGKAGLEDPPLQHPRPVRLRHARSGGDDEQQDSESGAKHGGVQGAVRC